MDVTAASKKERNPRNNLERTGLTHSADYFGLQIELELGELQV